MTADSVPTTPTPGSVPPTPPVFATKFPAPQMAPRPAFTPAPPERSETEVAMETFRDVAKIFSDGRVKETAEEQHTERDRIQADKEVDLASETNHRWILLGVATIATVSAVCAFVSGRPDLGTTIATSAVTGVLGFLAGKAVGRDMND